MTKMLSRCLNLFVAAVVAVTICAADCNAGAGPLFRPKPPVKSVLQSEAGRWIGRMFEPTVGTQPPPRKPGALPEYGRFDQLW